MNEYWFRQAKEPLFPDLLWSRPENKLQAGKLLIIGGHEHLFAAPAEAYSESLTAGIGVAKVLLPDKLQTILRHMTQAMNGDAAQGSQEEQTNRISYTGSERLTPADTVMRSKRAGLPGSARQQGSAMHELVWEFAPSNKSGSFSQKALAEWLDFADWANGVLLAGDFGRNSETSILIEKFLQKYSEQITLSKDAVDSITASVKSTLNRPLTTLVITIAQLQKICKDVGWPKSIKFDMGNIALVELLHEFSNKYSANIVVLHNGLIYVAVSGKISTTKVAVNDTWRVKTAARASVWLLQNPNKTFEALTTAVYENEKSQ